VTVGRVPRNNARVEVEVLYFAACPSWTVAVERLRRALDASGLAGTPIRTVPVETAADMAMTGFAGSPTVLVDGLDLFPGAAPVGELACRLYPTPEGLSGSPSLVAFMEALSQ
jgi:hypothetical protein